MGFFQRLFSKKDPVAGNNTQSEELKRLRELDLFMRSLLCGDHYVAKSEYRAKLAEYADLSTWFHVLQSSDTLEEYCKKYGSSQPEIAGILTRMTNFADLVDSQNEQYIKAQLVTEKNYLDNILRGSQSKKVLSDRLNLCKGYGKLAGAKRIVVQSLVEWLIENEYIRQTRGPYPVLHPTYNGEHYGEIITRQKLLALKRKLENSETDLESEQ